MTVSKVVDEHQDRKYTLNNVSVYVTVTNGQSSSHATIKCKSGDLVYCTGFPAEDLKDLKACLDKLLLDLESPKGEKK